MALPATEPVALSKDTTSTLPVKIYSALGIVEDGGCLQLLIQLGRTAVPLQVLLLVTN